MNRKGWIGTVTAAVVVLYISLYGIGQAAGQPAGSGPGGALPVPDGWQSVAAGQRSWYAFRYAGDGSAVLLDLVGSPASAVSFAVWSPSDVERWSRGGAESPTGRGSASAIYGGDLIWAGSSREPGVWYVAVDGPAVGPGSFNLKISGSGVVPAVTASAVPTATPALLRSSPAVAAPPATAVPARLAALAAAQATPVAPVQTGPLAYYNPRTPTPTRPAQDPARALPLPDGPQTLWVGQHTWYAFQYAGDRSPIEMRLHADPPGSANFTVWSWDVLQRWAEKYFYTPTGRGTANDVYNGDLSWRGGSIIKGKWYVVVEQNGTSPSTYTLQVTGTGIDRTLPPTPVPTPTYALPIFR